MIIAVAGGQSGAGRTTAATSLALALMQASRDLGLAGSIALADCDVGQPTTELLLRPLLRQRAAWSLTVPQVGESCIGSGECVDACRFHALSLYQGRAVLFPELCCGCLSCLRRCPERAITQGGRLLGEVATGRVGSLRWFGGTAEVGAAWLRPLVCEVLARAQQRPGELLIIDGPAGTGPAALEACRYADVALLVVEPSLAGLDILRRGVATLREHLACRVAVLLNKVGVGDLTEEVEAFCREAGAPIAGRLERSERIAAANARGLPLVVEWPERTSWFVALYSALREVVAP